MLWFDRHRRFRGLLSAYIDEQLSRNDARAVEAHVEGCGACRRELDEVRAAVMAVRDLPQMDVPRSFILSPEQVAQPIASPLPSTPPLAFGMRLAGAALAFALAVVLVADFGDFGGGNGPGTDGGLRSGAPESANHDELSGNLAFDVAPPEATGLPSGEAREAYDTTTVGREADKALFCDETGGNGVAGGPVGAPAATDVPQTIVEPTPAPTGPEPAENSPCRADGVDADSVPSPAVLDPQAELEDAIAEALELDRAADARTDSLSALRVVEIALAAALAAVVVGVAISLVVARRRAG
jgi:hypothetical protein